MTACCYIMLEPVYFTAVGEESADGRSWIPSTIRLLAARTAPKRRAAAHVCLLVDTRLVYRPGSASDLLV